MKCDTSKIRGNLAKLMKATGKAKRDAVRMAGRGFLRTIVDITPPAKGRADSTAKKRGEGAIASDLRRLFVIVSGPKLGDFAEAYGGKSVRESFGHKGAAALGLIERRIMQSPTEMAQWHQARRTKDDRVVAIQGGGDNNSNAHAVTTGLRAMDLRAIDVAYVERHVFLAYLQRVQALVGFLAAGWNVAASKLGVVLPAWIRRHTAAPGECREIVIGPRLRLQVTNAVSYVGNVSDYRRRVASAERIQAAKMERVAEFLLNRALKEAGF